MDNLYDNWNEYNFDQQLNIHFCQSCGDDMSPMESYSIPDLNRDNENFKKFVCLACWLDYKAEIAPYPTIGLHYGDNS